MVILGGLEVLAAGYLIHKHNKNKKERARLEEEAAALEEQQYPILPPTEHHRRRHHSHDRKHSHEGRHSHSHDRKPSRHHSKPPQSVPPPQYVAAAPSHVPVQQQPNNSQFFAPPPDTSMPQQQQQGGYYPPTGIPAHWEQQKAQPSGDSQTQQMKYGFYDGQEHMSRGRSDHRNGLTMEGGEGSARRSTDSERQHVRFADAREDTRGPPPRYNDVV